MRFFSDETLLRFRIKEKVIYIDIKLNPRNPGKLIPGYPEFRASLRYIHQRVVYLYYLDFFKGQ